MKKVYLVTMTDVSNQYMGVEEFTPESEYELIGIFSDKKEAIKIAQSIKYDYGIVHVNEVEFEKNYYTNENIDDIIDLKKSNVIKKLQRK